MALSERSPGEDPLMSFAHMAYGHRLREDVRLLKLQEKRDRYYMHVFFLPSSDYGRPSPCLSISRSCTAPTLLSFGRHVRMRCGLSPYHALIDFAAEPLCCVCAAETAQRGLHEWLKRGTVLCSEVPWMLRMKMTHRQLQIGVTSLRRCSLCRILMYILMSTWRARDLSAIMKRP